MRGEVKKTSGRLTSGLVEQRGYGSGCPSCTRNTAFVSVLLFVVTRDDLDVPYRVGKPVEGEDGWGHQCSFLWTTGNERGGRTEQEPIVSGHVGRLEDRVLRLGSSLHLDEDFVREDLCEPTLPSKPEGIGQ